MTAAAPQRTETELADEVASLHAELAALADDRMRAVNEKHGDDHAVSLTKLRGRQAVEDPARLRPRPLERPPRTPPRSCSPC